MGTYATDCSPERPVIVIPNSKVLGSRVCGRRCFPKKQQKHVGLLAVTGCFVRPCCGFRCNSNLCLMLGAISSYRQQDD